MKQCGLVVEVWSLISEDIVSIFCTNSLLIQGWGVSWRTLWCRGGMHASVSSNLAADITNHVQIPSQ